MYHSIDHRIF